MHGPNNLRSNTCQSSGEQSKCLFFVMSAVTFERACCRVCPETAQNRSG
jgi:hypothetical protein